MAAAATLAACADPEAPAGDDDAAWSVGKSERTLRRGDLGPDVESIYRFARQFGYFPNPQLEAMYPGWHPALASPPRDPRVFDEVLEEAVRLYQGANGLTVTGEVDAATRALMKQPRCGVPDLYQPAQAKSPGAAPGTIESNFVTSGTRWPNGHLTYSFTNFTGDLSTAAQRAAVSRAFSRWAAVAGLSFTEVPAGTPANIPVGWFVGAHGDGSAFDGPGNILAHGFAPPIGMVHFDDAEIWVNGAAPGTIDLESIAVHEIGHALGLAHSPVTAAIMFASFSGGTTKFMLNQDDIDGIRSIYGPTFLYSWSSAGPISGKSCTQITEPSDPDSWHDNFFCSDLPTGMAWSFAGPKSGTFWSCTAITEPSDSHTWGDNFLCMPKFPPPPPPFNVSFRWSFAGPLAGRTCVQWFETSDPDTWGDNYLCW